VRPYQRAIAGICLLAALTVTGLVHSPFVHAASLENGGPRSLPNLSYGKRADQKLDLYLPPTNKFFGPRPVIVWLHAGGWEFGSRKDPAPLPQYEVSRGYAMASVDYGLSPSYHFPTPVHDVKLAILWLKAHAPEYGLDPTTVFVAGYSAGAQLAAFVAVTPGRYEPKNVPRSLQRFNDRVVGTIDISGGYDLVQLTHSQNLWAREAGSALVGCQPTPPPAPLRCPAGVASAATVRNRLRPNAPPAYIVHAEGDELFLIKQQEAPLASAWTAERHRRDVDVQIVSGGHGIDINQLNLPRIDAFLDGIARIHRALPISRP
jgi:acetyl esterase/lipase